MSTRLSFTRAPILAAVAVTALGCNVSLPLDIGGGADSDSLDRQAAATDPDSASTDDDGWIPEAEWGEPTGDGASDGDPVGEGEGDSGYKKARMWRCLICEDDTNLTLPPPTSPEIGDTDTQTDSEPSVHYLSSDDSNSMSSPAYVRALIRQGGIVPKERLRQWEFLNYYDFDSEPAGDSPLRVGQQLRPTFYSGGRFAHQITIQGRALSGEDRKRYNLVLAIDVSGSVGGGPLERFQAVGRAIARNLRQGDRVSVVTWNDMQSVALEPLDVLGPNPPELLAALDGLTAGGTTALSTALTTGYELARSSLIRGGVNRVVLMSDGEANVGELDADIIGQAAAIGEQDAIYLIGVGSAALEQLEDYNDDLMDVVTDLGKGASVFIDSKDEAERMFGERFESLMDLSALDVTLRMTLPPYFYIDKYYGEEESGTGVESQHLSPNDAMIYQEALASHNPHDIDLSARIALHLEYTDPSTGAARNLDMSKSLQEMLDAPCPDLRKGDAILRYVQALRRISGMLVGYEEQYQIDLAGEECRDALRVVSSSAEALGDDQDLTEIAALLATYCDTVDNYTVLTGH